MKEIKKERNSNTKQIIFSVYNKTTTKRILRKWQKQKSNQHLKCWICLLFRLIAIPIDRESRRGAARSEENLFICHGDWSDSIDCLIDLFLHLICDARAATRNVTGASASSIDRASSIRVGVKVKLSSACGTWRSCLPPLLFARALRRGSNYVDLCTVRLHRSFDGTKSIDAVDKEEICNAKNENWFDDRARLIYNVLPDRIVTRPQIRLYVDNVSVCAARCSLAGRKRISMRKVRRIKIKDYK